MRNSPINFSPSFIYLFYNVSYSAALRHLNIAHNQITALPKELAALQLERFFADHNLLETVEPLEGMTSLRDLDLASNRIKYSFAL